MLFFREVLIVPDCFPVPVASFDVGVLEGEDELHRSHRAQRIPLDLAARVSILPNLRVEGGRRPDVVLAGTTAHPPDSPGTGSLLGATQLAPASLELGRLPPVRPVVVVNGGVLDPFHVLGGAKPEEEQVVGRELALTKLDQAQRGVGGPLGVERDFELRRSWDPLRDDRELLRRGLGLPDYAPDVLDTREVASWGSTGELPSVGERLSDDDELVDRQLLGLVHRVVDGLRLTVGQSALPWPSPTLSSVDVLGVEGADGTNPVPLHLPWSELPHLPEPLTLLLPRLI